MSKYIIGTDFAKGEDFTAYVVMRKPRWYERLLRRLRISKATWEWKVVDTWHE